jgi:soluble lytic murein transglycosylase-like protein
MQVRFAVWGSILKEKGIALRPQDLHDPHRGILAGCYVLRHYIDKHGSIRRALTAYSGGARGYAEKVMGVTL